MTDYQHILLAVDYSVNNDYIADKAKGLAERYQAKLSILHVLDNIPMPDTNYGTVILLSEKTDYDLLEAEKTKLLVLGQRLAVADDNQWLVWGVPKEEIIHIASQENIDLIVLGSHERHGLGLLLGSIANSVLQHSPCDVLAVHLSDR